jgi:hypothetical protein
MTNGLEALKASSMSLFGHRPLFLAPFGQIKKYNQPEEAILPLVWLIIRRFLS